MQDKVARVSESWKIARYRTFVTVVLSAPSVNMNPTSLREVSANVGAPKP